MRKNSSSREIKFDLAVHSGKFEKSFVFSNPLDQDAKVRPERRSQRSGGTYDKMKAKRAVFEQ